MSPPPADAVVVFLLVFVALALFLSERFPPDVTALGLLVALVVLRQWTHVSPSEAIQGFANQATITIIGMYILSEGVRQTGVVSRIGDLLAEIARNSERRLLGATVLTTGVGAGFVNNTPIVAVFIPMVSDLAAEFDISPSKLLLPLSYAAMLGGTLTLIGTATNILVADLSAKLLDHPISMFEFTPLGMIVLVVGVAYLLTVGRWLTPARVEPDRNALAAFELERHLARVIVREGSPLVGRSIQEITEAIESGRPPPEVVAEDVSTEMGEEIEDLVEDIDIHVSVEETAEDEPSPIDLDLLQIVKDGDTTIALGSEREIEVGDTLTVRGNRREVNRFAETYRLRQLPRDEVTDADLDVREGRGRLVEVVLPEKSRFVGDTVREANLAAYHNAVVMAVRTGGEVRKEQLADLVLAEGDSLLLQVRERDLRYLVENRDVIVIHGVGVEEPPEKEPEPLSPKTPIALVILAGVVITAGVGLLPIAITALGGVVLMFATGVLSPRDGYRAVSWNVIFLLAGVIPLGTAMLETGGAAYVASLIVQASGLLPPLVVLGLFYVLTGLLSNVITPVATVVLITPIAVDTATKLQANGFAFVLAVLFAASTAFMTPVGYQTNMMVYGPGGYRFTDYLRVGAPLQMLLAVVTTVGITVMWGL